MDASSLRWRYYLTSAVVVVLVLAAFQYWRNEVDPGFLIGVGIVYVVLSVGIDLFRGPDE